MYKSDFDIIKGLFVGLFFGTIISAIIILNIATFNIKIESQKQFILNNATYKCEMTNKLVGIPN